MKDEFSAYLQRTTLVANRKGGVLKSSIVRSVAEEARRQGYNVLVVDGDPQGNLSKLDFGLDQARGPDGKSAWEVDRGRSLAMALQFGTELAPTAAHGVDVICGGPELLGVLGAANSVDLNLAGNLRSSLARLTSQRRYDLILVDSGPGDTKLLDAYMLTARWLVVPIVDGDEASFDGLDKIGSRTVDLIRNHDAELELLGAVLTLVDPKAPKRNQQVIEDLTASLGVAATPFAAMIRDAKAARADTRKYGLSAAEVADRAKEIQRGRLSALSALRRRKAAAKRAGEDPEQVEVPEALIDNPEEPWATRNGDAIASDYRDLTIEILSRIGERLEVTASV